MANLLKFELSEGQHKRFKEWMQEIREKHGNYGEFEFRFTPTGIGVGLEIYSHNEKKALDFTEYETW